MAALKVLLIDQGDSILSNLTHVLDERPVALEDEPDIYAVRNLAESRRLLEKHGRDDKWKVIVIGREGGTEPAAQDTVQAIRAQFAPHLDVPVLLVTKATGTPLKALESRLRHAAKVLAVDPALDFDLMDTRDFGGKVTPKAERMFDALISDGLSGWLQASPDTARAFPKRT